MYTIWREQIYDTYSKNNEMAGQTYVVCDIYLIYGFKCYTGTSKIIDGNIWIGNIISFHNISVHLKDKKSVQKWNNIIINNKHLCFIPYINREISICDEDKQYTYIGPLYNVKTILQFSHCNNLYYTNKCDINIFLRLPLKGTYPISISTSGTIICGRDIYTPLLNKEYKSLHEFWNTNTSTIYKIRSIPYYDIKIYYQ